MRKPLVGSAAAALFGAAALVGIATAPAVATSPAGSATTAAPAKGAASATPSFEGTVALSNCSGSLVKLKHSRDTDPALVLSNGHCLQEGMPGAGEVVVGKKTSRDFTLLNADGSDAGKVHSDKIAYATMTDTDISLYETTSTYREIRKKYGIDALRLDARHPRQGREITVVSGYWKETFGCAIDGFAHRLKEADWTWKDSIRYTMDCQTKGGTSGSPVIDNATGKVVGVNNTHNEDGERCTLNNPCEVDEDGNVSVRHLNAYGQQTYLITPCFGRGNQLALDARGCVLPEPKG
ncbi:trypsin-like peptidase domain-containing protein [Streptomyces albus subsp. chlorinus]|uniref:S1 family peptidase n=1 Tax=Streptomyces albus TaxID=1888 RepID=UPI00156DF667|nr:serine protease [Streptomyces albus]NSC23617.1 trypsin-like peptidase domain-containing protein [Streptomyces albus subsp. chlorinus]